MVKNTKKYIPVDCGFVDVIEHYATLKEQVMVYYLNDSNKISRTAQLKTWENIQGEEFLILMDGTSIRLDYLLRIGDYDAQGVCVIPKDEEE